MSADGSSTTAWYEAGDIEPGLQPFIDLAVADLADRLEVADDDIAVRAAVLVVWPDSSLGCPEPDMAYAQVLTDGSVTELEHDGLFYRYHSGGQEGPFLCTSPLAAEPPPALDAGTGGDT